MKRFGLRTLVVLSGVVLLFSLIAGAYTVAQLEDIASNELIPEISTAAGMALASSYAQSKTVAELEDLAVNGRTIGLRTAASKALEILYRDKTEDELMAIAGGDQPEMIRAAAVNPLVTYLIAKKADALKAMAADADTTHEVRLAAARAYYFITRGKLKAADLEKQAVTNDSAELAYAAGEVLAGFYLSFNPKTQAELEDLAQNGKTAGLRIAGAIALSSKLIESDLTAQDLEKVLVAGHGVKSAEYLYAYEVALANRYGK